MMWHQYAKLVWITLYIIGMLRFVGSSDVSISTCNTTISTEPMTVCCFTENIPTSASVFVSITTVSGSAGIIRLKSDCTLINNNSSAVRFSCNWQGLVRKYMILYNSTVSENSGYQFRCGFYGKTSSTLTVDPQYLLTDYAGSDVTDEGSDVILSWQIPTNVSTNVTVYSPTHQLLLVYDWINQTAYPSTPRIEYLGNGSNFTIQLKNIEREDNGTYVCEYDAFRSGRDIIVRGAPRKPIVLTMAEFVNAGSGSHHGHIYCRSGTGSAAPLFYNQSLTYQWLTPNPSDNPGFVVPTETELWNLFITVDCNSMTSLPVYCQVTEYGLSAISEPWYPHQNVCVPVVPTEEPASGTIIAIIIISCLFWFTLVISIVVGRRRVKRCSKRMFKQCGKCCRSCEDCGSSDSDSDRMSDIFRSSTRHRPPRRLSLNDDMQPRREQTDVERALEQIAIEESRLAAQRSQSRADGNDNMGLVDDNPGPVTRSSRSSTMSASSFSLSELGAVGGFTPPPVHVQLPEPAGLQLYEPPPPLHRSLHLRPEGEQAVYREVQTLLDQNNRHLNSQAVTLEVKRSLILDSLLGFYTDESIALSRITVKMLDEDGLDCGGVTSDMFTTFWDKARDRFFLGSEAVVPYLPNHRLGEDKTFRVLGRILSHTVAVLKEIPIPMCKSAFVGMIYNTRDVAEDVVLEDFLLFLDEQDRKLVTTAISGYDSFSSNQQDDVTQFFERFDYAFMARSNFIYHLKQLAKLVILERPYTLLEMMRSGLPGPHLEHFWSRFHLESLTVLFKALQPTTQRIVNRIRTMKSSEDLSRKERRVFRFLQDFVVGMSHDELEVFLHLVTGKKSTPREPIMVEFISESGFARMPKFHTCSNTMELPDSYDTYEKFKTEVKALLASPEALTMNME